MPQTLQPDRLIAVRDLSALLAFLRDELDWPIEGDQIEEMTFDWSGEELKISDSSAQRLRGGSIRQLQPVAEGQPWGIFFVEFADDRVYRTSLREILRGLVPNRRRDSGLPAWRHDNLLFICATANCGRFSFVHFRGEKSEKARLAAFGWETGSSYLRTLCEFNLPALRWPENPGDGTAWLKAWAAAFDKEPLTKEFFRDIANWYFWALKHVRFPKDAPKEQDGKDHVSVIRLITRLIFCWFVKQKGLLPDALFDPSALECLLKDFAPDDESKADSVYYRAILQNLFFATLNTEMDRRDWARDDQNFMAHCLYRHKECFRKPAEALDVFRGIPFLNGGLFECLDRDLGNSRYLRVDGFSRRPDSQPIVPDFLFFGADRVEDLSAEYGETRFRRAKVCGLIRILRSYNFTIEENTPLNQEVALDPELAGNVFENLLAAYNPVTGATARKATGSFYTPREIVDYMVDESLAAYFRRQLAKQCDTGIPGCAAQAESSSSGPQAGMPASRCLEDRLRALLAYDSEKPEFSEAETETLIAAIDGLKALDPAVGSGAFPMGILHKLVHVLSKLDPNNERWKAKQIAKLDDAVMREDAERIFRENYDNYGRKLYLIENCIYGVDIQPIAVQIAKMRFFISLIADQNIAPNAPNLGVRALPNLETKFVAANTLIGIERPKQLLLRNPEIDRKEAELRKVRERHFTAKTPKAKARCREDDRRLRAEIAALLRNDGWGHATAKQLADWDPYDQNSTSSFFDSEWMFGITGGFDVVIGNPPYGFRNVLSAEEKRYFRQRQGIDFPSGDIAELFIVKCLDGFVRDDHCLAFIIPKKSLYGESWGNVRSLWLRNSLRCLMDASQAFDNVLLEQAAFVLEKRAPTGEGIAIGRLDSSAGQVSVFGIFERDSIFVPPRRCAQIYRGLYPPALLEKIANASVSGGDALLKAEIGISNITAHLTFERKGNYPCLKGIDITRYGLKSDPRYLDGRVAKPFVEAYSRNKLIAQEIVAHILHPTPHISIAMYWDEEGRLFNDTCVEIRVLDSRLDPLFVLGYLQSRFVAWYAYHLIYNRAVRTMHFIDFYVSQIPMPRTALEDPARQRPVAGLARRILDAKKADPNADTATMEGEIDRLVYGFYGFGDNEIAMVETGGP